jgi:phosphoglycerate dehydrogenase-like enzyme
MKVHLLHPPQPEALAFLQAALNPAISLVFGEIQEPADFDILVAGRPARADLLASPNLRILVIPFAGLPPPTRTLMLDFQAIAVHNLHHNASATAETALALLLAAAKFLLPFDRDLRRHDWSRRYQPNPSLLLEGKTALILGFGAIGQRLGRFCHALGMTVIGVRRHPDQIPSLDYPAEIHTLRDLPALLPRAQVLLIALPATPHTDGILGKTALEALHPGAVIVNVGRAAVIDQAALYHALQTGRLRAAGLDVWVHYPATSEDQQHTPPADYPFHELDNVVLSPHRGGLVEEIETLRMQALADLLNAAAENRPLPGKVDILAGY